jgi:hypothetical protein
MSDTTTVTDQIVDKTLPSTPPETGEIQKDSKNFKALRESKEASDSRIAELEAELDNRKKADEERENKALEEQGKFKELAEKEKLKTKELEEKYTRMTRQSQIEKFLQSQGLNPDVLEFVSPKVLTDTKWDKDENPENLDKIVENMKTKQPFFFGEVKETTAGQYGTGITNNSNPNNLADSADNASLGHYIQSQKS